MVLSDAVTGSLSVSARACTREFSPCTQSWYLCELHELLRIGCPCLTVSTYRCVNATVCALVPVLRLWSVRLPCLGRCRRPCWFKSAHAPRLAWWSSLSLLAPVGFWAGSRLDRLITGLVFGACSWGRPGLTLRLSSVRPGRVRSAEPLPLWERM